MVGWAKWEALELPSSSVPAKIVNQKNYCHILGETAEISDTIKNLEVVELVPPITESFGSPFWPCSSQIDHGEWPWTSINLTRWRPHCSFRARCGHFTRAGQTASGIRVRLLTKQTLSSPSMRRTKCSSFSHGGGRFVVFPQDCSHPFVLGQDVDGPTVATKHTDPVSPINPTRSISGELVLHSQVERVTYPQEVSHPQSSVTLAQTQRDDGSRNGG